GSLDSTHFCARGLLICGSSLVNVALKSDNCSARRMGGRKMTIADGNGAVFLAFPNFNRPLTNRISLACMTWSCHARVSVRDGMRNTLSAPCRALALPFASHTGA